MTEKLTHTIFQYLNSEYKDLTQFETEEYPRYIFFMKDGEVVFEYNKINEVVYISYEKIWSFLQSFFELECEEIQDLTKEWVEQHCKLRITTTIGVIGINSPKVEQHCKLRITTTSRDDISDDEEVVQHYKLETNDR